MEAPKSYGSVKLSTLKAAIKQIEDHFQDCPERLEDVDITFEYLIGSFFPEVVKNVRDEANKQYTLGYIHGIKRGRSEVNDNQRCE